MLAQAARGGIVLVGDLMKSITVLRFDSDINQFMECASRALKLELSLIRFTFEEPVNPRARNLTRSLRRNKDCP